MQPVNLILNVLWLVCGGLACAVGWCIAGVIMAITIVGLPWSFACFRLAQYTFFPFGQEMVSADLVEGGGAGCFSMIGNVFWFVFAGWWLFLGHVFSALLCAITIIGIPFAWAHLKLAMASLFPLGRRIVTIDHADALRYARRS